MLTSPRVILCDLIADLALHVESFPIVATDLSSRSTSIWPGRRMNAAIMARRLALPVACLGEVGADCFGDAVVRDCAPSGSMSRAWWSTRDAWIPVAGVPVDPAPSRPTPYPGTFRLTASPEAWLQPLQVAQAAYADGWAEHAGVAATTRSCLPHRPGRRCAGLFRPRPGNPALDNAWHLAAAALATVVLLDVQEAERLTGHAGPRPWRRRRWPTVQPLAVVKRGGEGRPPATARETCRPAYPVTVGCHWRGGQRGRCRDLRWLNACRCRPWRSWPTLPVWRK